MSDSNDYPKVLAETLTERARWLDNSELPKLKDELRLFHTGFAALYNLYIKKGLIHEDPYKQESKISELEVPNAAPFAESDNTELTNRLSSYDNQLDFLANFYQFTADYLTLDRIKRILTLIKYIEWTSLTPDSKSPTTRVVAVITNQVKTGTDPLTMSIISDSLSRLSRSINPIMGYLKLTADYQRESYKLELREVAAGMSAAEASNASALRKKLLQVKPNYPFYPDLADEMIKEDYSEEGPALREAVLKKLQLAGSKPKAKKQEVSFKSILLEGIQGLGSMAVTFTEIITKIDENQLVLQNKKRTLMEKVKRVIQQMFNKETAPVIYEVEYIDTNKGASIKEKVDFYAFRSDLDRKVRTLTPLAARGEAAMGKLASMQEDQLAGFLERSIRDIQSLHKVLGALDDFFKAQIDKEDREKIKGIKPELAVLKNAIIRANSRRHEYSAQKESEAQLKRLGVSSDEQEISP